MVQIQILFAIYYDQYVDHIPPPRLARRRIPSPIGEKHLPLLCVYVCVCVPLVAIANTQPYYIRLSICTPHFPLRGANAIARRVSRLAISARARARCSSRSSSHRSPGTSAAATAEAYSIDYSVAVRRLPSRHVLARSLTFHTIQRRTPFTLALLVYFFTVVPSPGRQHIRRLLVHYITTRLAQHECDPARCPRPGRRRPDGAQRRQQ